MIFFTFISLYSFTCEKINILPKSASFVEISLRFELFLRIFTKGRFIIYEDDRVGKKIIAFLFLSKARPKGILFFRSPFSI